MLFIVQRMKVPTITHSGTKQWKGASGVFRCTDGLNDAISLLPGQPTGGNSSVVLTELVVAVVMGTGLVNNLGKTNKHTQNILTNLKKKVLYIYILSPNFYSEVCTKLLIRRLRNVNLD